MDCVRDAALICIFGPGYVIVICISVLVFCIDLLICSATMMFCIYLFVVWLPRFGQLISGFACVVDCLSLVKH
jgi:hypothetical protein